MSYVLTGEKLIGISTFMGADLAVGAEMAQGLVKLVSVSYLNLFGAKKNGGDVEHGRGQWKRSTFVRAPSYAFCCCRLHLSLFLGFKL